jgi:hypothetical protein
VSLLLNSEGTWQFPVEIMLVVPLPTHEVYGQALIKCADDMLSLS